ncbi:hypothetical protein [uncultured Nisaea sp.]|uniref:hypothetical protein n=1 Tax=uncultured Nisaea sp. TaxID=538215 RepID=UPI0030EB1547|tara:strand:- start:306 stop:578 length:273 start_codon:yes stop_codon:yes gene_type:complete
MRPATLLRLLLGLAYAATAGWLLYDYSDEAASLLRGRWLKELWPGAETVIRVSWLYDLRIIAVPLYAVLGLWIAERIWQRLSALLPREPH